MIKLFWRDGGRNNKTPMTNSGKGSTPQFKKCALAPALHSCPFVIESWFDLWQELWKRLICMRGRDDSFKPLPRPELWRKENCEQINLLAHCTQLSPRRRNSVSAKPGKWMTLHFGYSPRYLLPELIGFRRIELDPHSECIWGTNWKVERENALTK